MDKEVAETLAYFSEHAFELRQLGKEWGLNEEEIEHCIEQAMSIDPKDLPAPDEKTTATLRMKFAARKTWPKFRVFLWIVGVFMALVAVGVLALQNEQIQHRVSQIIAPAIYPFFRYFRLATMSLHDRFNLYNAYSDDCMVHNPLFNKENLLGDHICENCNSVTNIKEFTVDSRDQKSLSGALMDPLLFKGRGRNITLETFQSVLSNNPFVQQPMLGLTTNLKWASQVKDLLGPDVTEKFMAQPDFYFTWNSKLVWTSQIMRKVFPKPAIIKLMDVAIEKSIFITGPRADSFQLPSSSVSTHSWYMQGTGSRKIVLTPVSRCQRECSAISATLNQGDMFMYNAEIYHTTVHPDGDDVSIAFLGHFNIY